LLHFLQHGHFIWPQDRNEEKKDEIAEIGQGGQRERRPCRLLFSPKIEGKRDKGDEKIIDTIKKAHELIQPGPIELLEPDSWMDAKNKPIQPDNKRSGREISAGQGKKGLKLYPGKK